MKDSRSEAKAEKKTTRKWLSWKTQLGVVAALGAVAWVGRFLWFRAKRAVA